MFGMDYMSCYIINLEAGLPTVSAARSRLINGLQTARMSGRKTVKIIHGYGSGGKGGAIKRDTHIFLSQKQLARYVPRHPCTDGSNHAESAHRPYHPGRCREFHGRWRYHQRPTLGGILPIIPGRPMAVPAEHLPKHECHCEPVLRLAWQSP